MIPFHVYIFRLYGATELVMALIALAALNLLAILIALITLMIRRRLKHCVFSMLLCTKHHLLLLAIISSAVLLLQPYLAVTVTVAWYLWGWKLFETDHRYKYLLNFEVNQRGKYKRLYADVNPFAQAVQEVPTIDCTWGEILAMHEKNREVASQFDPSKRPDYQPKRSDFFAFPLLQTAFYATLAITVCFIASLTVTTTPDLIATATGFAFGFLALNEFFEITVFFLGLGCGLFQLSMLGPTSSYHRSTHSFKLIFLVGLLYLSIVCLYFGGLFGWL